MGFKRYRVPRHTSTEERGFILDGWDTAENREFSETFRCRPKLAAGALLKFGAASNDENGMHTLSAITDLLKTALYPDDYKRFMAIINDPDLAVELSLLSEIIGDLASGYSGDRPTGESLLNSSDKLSTGGDSTGGASVGTPTYSRSLPTEPST